MGSEHYCLRWNNHQSNLLGVFSQLLQDESLVDVTLACSEGAPIRAHKVVLSACSSYFQSLFLDHPERHPIVILKDVRFAELQTLVEFMYKGEVNVQYCQLSALLKTAESLKVKGLAEMTNQNTTLREPEREPDRLRPHSQPTSKSTCDSPVDVGLAAGPSTSTSASSSSASSTGTISGSVAATNAALASAAAAAATAALASATTTTAAAASATATAVGTTASAHKRDASERERERCSSTPPKRLLTSAATTTTSAEQDTPLPLDLYQRRAAELTEESGAGGERTRTGDGVNASNTTANVSSNHSTSNQQQLRSTTPSGSGTGGTASQNSHNNGGGDDRDLYNSPERPASSLHESGGLASGCVEKIEDVDDYDEEMDLEEAEDDNSEADEVGLNMKISGIGSGGGGLSHSAAATSMIPSPLGGGGDPESARLTPSATITSGGLPSDRTQRPASRSSRDGGGGHTSSAAASVSAGTDHPSSSGLCVGLMTTSGIGAGGGISPSSSAALGNEPLAGPSGLGPVQSVPLSLKKEIDCSEDDNSNNSRHHTQPFRSASAGGGLGGDIDYRASHESETSESPHGGSGGIGGTCGGNSSSTAGGASSTTAAGPHHDQPLTPPPMYPCPYCGAAFPHQSKLTRHILSHSLKTLEYRETATHPLLHPHLLPHDLNMAPLPQQFAYQMNAAMAASGAGDSQEQAAAVAAAAAAAIEMDFAAAVAAAGGCALTGLTGCGGARGLVDLDGSGRGLGSSSGNGGLGGGSASSPSCSGLLLSGAGSSSSTSAAAAAAAASSSLLGVSNNDPNSVVLCKFCGKSFPDVASLITHLPVHTGDRPFKCEFCGKAFKLRHHMKDHCRVHTGERPFRCHMCGKTFSRSTILKAHEKTHFPKYVRKFLSPSPVDTKDELPQ